MPSVPVYESALELTMELTPGRLPHGRYPGCTRPIGVRALAPGAAFRCYRVLSVACTTVILCIIYSTDESSHIKIGRLHYDANT